MPSITALKGLFPMRAQGALTTFDLSPIKYNDTAIAQLFGL
jgi:hypothetical protein